MHSEIFRMAVEASPTAMIVVDTAGTIVHANARAGHVFGYERAALVGGLVERLVPDATRGRHVGLRARFQDDREVRQMGSAREVYARRADGTTFPAEIGLNPFSSEDGVFVLCSVVDLTERKAAEQLRATMVRELHHRVKNNLQIVASFLNIEAAGLEEAHRGPFRRTVERVHAMALVHEYLQDADLTSTLDLGAYLRQLTDQLCRSYAAPQILVQSRFCAVTVPQAVATPCGLILTELLTNAWKHAFPANVGTITVELSVSSEAIELRVADDGVGTARPARTGLRLANALAGQISATLDRPAERPGTTTIVRIPRP